jgi:hypothetical protein
VVLPQLDTPLRVVPVGWPRHFSYIPPRSLCISPSAPVEDADRGDRVIIDGVDYELRSLPSAAQEAVRRIRFIDERILQCRNELAIADTARMAYAAALDREMRNRS